MNCVCLFVCLFVGCRQAIAEPLRSHGLTVDQIDVYLASSSTPLPLSSDCFRLAGSFLYVRGTPVESLLAFLPRQRGDTRKTGKNGGTTLNHHTISLGILRVQFGYKIVQSRTINSSNLQEKKCIVTHIGFILQKNAMDWLETRKHKVSAILPHDATLVRYMLWLCISLSKLYQRG